MTPSAVFDCNVFLQAMLSVRGPAHACWQSALSGDTLLAISPFIIAEILRLPEHRSLRRFNLLTPERIERFVEELLKVAKLEPDPPSRFSYPRDPDDARYVDLAIATNSLLVVSNDLDLLDLMDEANPDGKALRKDYPGFAVVTPPQFLALVRRPPHP